MKEGILAKRYARALFAAGEEQKSLERWQDELVRLKEIFASDPFLLKYLCLREVEPKKKEELLATLAKQTILSPLMTNFLKLLLQKGRFNVFPAIVEAFSGQVRESQNTVLAHVDLANQAGFSPLKDSLQTVLEKKLGKRVEFQLRESPALIGGFTVRVGDTIYDASVQGTLEGLRESGGSHATNSR